MCLQANDNKLLPRVIQSPCTIASHTVSLLFALLSFVEWFFPDFTGQEIPNPFSSYPYLKRLRYQSGHFIFYNLIF